MQSFDICRLAMQVIMKVGQHIRSQQQTVRSQALELKGRHDFVTETDKKVEKALVDALQTILPGSGFITEEKTIAQEFCEYTWIIDPIDGTTNFIHGVPLCSVSVALTHNGQTIIGIVYEVHREECFYAVKGAGAFLNGDPIHCAPNRDLDKALIATGFPYTSYDKIDPYLATLKQFMYDCRGVRRLGSAAADLAYVACGRFDAFFEYGLSPWDIAAGALLIEEAGGCVTDFQNEGNYSEKKEILASNGMVHDAMLKVIQTNFTV